MKQFSEKAFNKAHSLINDGKINLTAPWGFSPEDGNKILGKDNNWKEFASWHLGSEFGVPEENKGFYSFPYGKNGKVYRSALVAIKQRAGQSGDGEIQQAADDLLVLMDEQQSEDFVASSTHIINGVLPEWINIAPHGDHLTVKGRFIMYDDDAALVLAHFNEHYSANDMPIDYDHSTITQGAQVIAGAWVDKLDWRGKDGLWAHVKSYTKKAANHIKAGEYRYISPIIMVDGKTRRARRLANAAFTNMPAFRGLVPLVANLEKLSHDGIDTQEETMEELLRLLGLAEGADADAMVEAVKKLIARAEGAETSTTEHAAVVASMGGIFAAFGLDTLDMAALEPLVMTAQRDATEVVGLREEIVTLTAKITSHDNQGIEALVLSGIASGKILPVQKPWALELGGRDRASLEAFIANAVPVVPAMSDADRESARKLALKTGASGDSAEAEMVMSALEVTPKMREDHGPK